MDNSNCVGCINNQSEYSMYCVNCSRHYRDRYINADFYNYMIDRVKYNLSTITERSCIFCDETCYNRSIDICLRCDHVSSVYLSEQGV